MDLVGKVVRWGKTEKVALLLKRKGKTHFLHIIPNGAGKRLKRREIELKMWCHS